MREIHRDDLDANDAEAIVRELQKQYPGYTIRFAGDGRLSPEAAEAVAALERKFHESIVNGICGDCGAKMPDYPAVGDDFTDDWQPPAGWQWFKDMATGEPLAWQCPTCDQAESVERDLGGEG